MTLASYSSGGINVFRPVLKPRNESVSFKIFFGYTKHSSVTKMLLELRLPSLRTVLMNGRSVFRCMWEKCNNSIAQFFSSISLYVVVVFFLCYVYFCCYFTYFSTVFVFICVCVLCVYLSVLIFLFYGPCRLK